MKKFSKTPLAVAMGTAVLSGFAANATADSNPFAMTELSNGYMQVAVKYDAKQNQGSCGSNATDSSGNPVGKAKGDAKKSEGSCGEGMCGAMMSGGKMKKGMEQSCGAMMKGKEGACGMMGGMNHEEGNKAAQKPKGEEGSCGAMMGHEKGGEASCGAMMKGGEGSCGSKVDADKAAGK